MRRSPVSSPTDSAPYNPENRWNFWLESAFRGVVYQATPPAVRISLIACSAIQVFPLPVGAATNTSPARTAASAASWNGAGTNGAGGGVPTSWIIALSLPDVGRRSGSRAAGRARGGHRAVHASARPGFVARPVPHHPGSLL